MAEAEAEAKEASAKAKAEQRARAKERVLVPDGWATAVAAEALRDFKGRKFCAVDWFATFSAHPLAKKSSERPRRPEELLARFVVAVNDLQIVGFASACKRPRGTIEKRVFS